MYIFCFFLFFVYREESQYNYILQKKLHGTRAQNRKGIKSLHAYTNMLTNLVKGLRLLSLDLRRYPNSLKKAKTSSPRVPDVSMAIGTKWCVGSISQYRCFFLVSARFTTLPAPEEARDT